MNKLIVNKHFLFPTLVYSCDNFISNEECYKIKQFLLENVELSDHGAIPSSHGKSSFFTHQNVIFLLEENNIVSKLKQRLDLVVKEYEKENKITVCLSNVELHNSWYNIQKKDSVLHFHVHEGAIFAGALYIETDSDSSNLMIRNYNHTVNFISEHSDVVEFEPRMGRLILFPGWMEHGFNSLNQSKNRIVVSFNYGVSRPFIIEKH